MKESSYLEIKNYFENLVKQSNFLEDFVGYSQLEWANRTGSRKGLKSPNLTLFKYRLGFDGPEQNTIAVRQIGFAIMFNNIKKDDFTAQYNAIDKAEKMALKVISRINFDNHNTDHFLYNSFLKDSVEISPVELSAADFGVEVFFNFKNKQSLSVSPDDWLDIDSVC